MQSEESIHNDSTERMIKKKEPTTTTGSPHSALPPLVVPIFHKAKPYKLSLKSNNRSYNIYINI